VYASIVVGTDGSESAQRAVAEATRLAKALGGELHLVSAFEPQRGVRIAGAPTEAARIWAPTPDAGVKTVIDQAEATVKMSRVAVKSHTITGDPADALLKVAEQEKADLIVVGSRGMHGVSRVLGSVPNKVSHRAHCNVLIVSTEDAGS
jgi:nucleotide-binding universal stress UspA family protein